MSNSLQPHGLQHARLPCLTISRHLSDSCPLMVMPSNHLILYHPLLLLPSIFLSIRVFSYELEHYIYYTNCFDLWSNIIPCGEGNGTPLQYSCLENPMDRGAWKAAVHGVAEGGTRLSDFTFTFHFHALEKEMATHSSVLAWRIPGTGSLVGCRL